MKTAIVLGATGLVGSKLIDQLVVQNDIQKVVAITRRPVKYPFGKVINEVVDFEHLKDFSQVSSGDMLFSCLGTTRKRAGSVQAQRTVDVDYQLKAAELAADNGVHHYLLVSSSGAGSRSKSAYLKMKGELEDQVLSLPFARISIFQPSLLVGDRDHFRMGEVMASWIMPALCLLPGLRCYRPIKGEQVAAKMVRVSQSSGEARERFSLDEIAKQ